MAKQIPWEWLYGQARDEDTVRLLGEIRRERELVISQNRLSQDDTLIPLTLGDQRLWLHSYSAFSQIEVYAELFRNNGHALAEGFSGEKARVVVDLGANEGHYLLRLKSANPGCRVIAVEPNPSAFELLLKNVEANGLNDVVLMNRAVAGVDGQLTLPIVKQIPAIGGRSLLEVERPWMRAEFVDMLRVDAISLTSLWRLCDLDRVDLLKLDIEGMEVDVLAAAAHLLPRVHRVVVEYHSKASRESVCTLLAGAGLDLAYEEDPEQASYYGDLYFVNRQWPEASPLNQ